MKSTPIQDPAGLPAAAGRLEQPLRSAALPRSAPGEWDEGAGLRETMLQQLPRKTADSFRYLLAQAYSAAMEQGTALPALRGSLVQAQLRAVEADLRHNARFLALVAKEALVVFSSSRGDIALGRLADSVAVQVEALADQLRPKPRNRRKNTPPEAGKGVSCLESGLAAPGRGEPREDAP